MGMVGCEVSWDSVVVEHVSLTDITKRCRNKNCTLNHSKNMVDRVDHFIQQHKEILDKADRVLLEKQPITGLIAVEQLLFDRLRDKVRFVYPMSLQSYFGMRHLQYEERKEFLVNKMWIMLEGTIFEDVERKHDIADAMAMIMYWQKNSTETLRPLPVNQTNPFDQFRCCVDN